MRSNELAKFDSLKNFDVYKNSSQSLWDIKLQIRMSGNFYSMWSGRNFQIETESLVQLFLRWKKGPSTLFAFLFRIICTEKLSLSRDRY